MLSLTHSRHYVTELPTTDLAANLALAFVMQAVTGDQGHPAYNCGECSSQYGLYVAPFGVLMTSDL